MKQTLEWPCAYCGKTLSDIHSHIMKKFCDKCKVIREKERNKEKYSRRKSKSGKAIFLCIVCGRTTKQNHWRRFCSDKCKEWKRKEKLLLEQLVRLKSR